jgi:hypothetical protein
MTLLSSIEILWRHPLGGMWGGIVEEEKCSTCDGSICLCVRVFIAWFRASISDWIQIAVRIVGSCLYRQIRFAVSLHHAVFHVICDHIGRASGKRAASYALQSMCSCHFLPVGLVCLRLNGERQLVRGAFVLPAFCGCHKRCHSMVRPASGLAGRFASLFCGCSICIATDLGQRGGLPF